MLACLKLPELRDLARKMKLKVVDSRVSKSSSISPIQLLTLFQHSAIIDLLLANAGKQTTLANYFSRAGQSKKGQTTRLRDMVKGITGTCLLLSLRNSAHVPQSRTLHSRQLSDQTTLPTNQSRFLPKHGAQCHPAPSDSVSYKGEQPVKTKLPGISTLPDHYHIPLTDCPPHL